MTFCLPAFLDPSRITSSFCLHPWTVPCFKQTIPVDDYVLDVLMRDLVGHDQQPAAYLVYLFLYGQATRMKWKPIAASVRTLADATGFSKSAIQVALATLRRRHLRGCVQRSAIPPGPID